MGEFMKKDLILLHLAVMLFGLAGVISKFISLPAISVTFGRVFFSSIFLWILIKIKKENIRLIKKDYLVVIIAGIILALHWYTFIKSIQTASVAIGTLTFSVFPLFVTFLEPLVFHESFNYKNILIALIMLVGVMITVPELSLNNHMTLGIVIGLISALSYACLCLFNRYLSKSYSSRVICFYEQATATVVLLPSLFLISISYTYLDLSILIFLGIVCTAIVHSIYISSLKHINVQLAGLISGMESVYSIILAFILLKQGLSLNEFVGGIVIISTSIYASIHSSH